MNKKLVVCVLASSVLTNVSCFAQNFYENLPFAQPYVKLELGGQNLNTVKLHGEKDIYMQDIFASRPKYKSKINSFVGLGVGSYWSDNFRTDLIFNYYIEPKFDLKAKSNLPLNISGDAKINLWSLMLNGYMDVIRLEPVQIYAGAGLGLAHLTAKTTTHLQVDHVHLQDTIISKSKAAKNFAYSLTAGASYSITETTKFDLAYSWRDFGKTSAKWKNDKEDSERYHIKGHHITAGLRFNI